MQDLNKDFCQQEKVSLHHGNLRNFYDNLASFNRNLNSSEILRGNVMYYIFDFLIAWFWGISMLHSLI